METSRDVLSYLDFKSVIDLGISISLSDVKFEDAMVYTWIKGALSERKT